MNLVEQKQVLRGEAIARRERLTGRDELSRLIMAHVLDGPWMANVEMICSYVSMGSEVRTHELIKRLLTGPWTVCVPWCGGNELKLARILSLDELRPRTLGILEPPRSLREDPARIVVPETVGLQLVPGLAFSTDGKRLGYGRGYYDRLLARSSEAKRIGLAFNCQIFSDVPTGPQDVSMHRIVTETDMYAGNSTFNCSTFN